MQRPSLWHCILGTWGPRTSWLGLPGVMYVTELVLHVQGAKVLTHEICCIEYLILAVTDVRAQHLGHCQLTGHEENEWHLPFPEFLLPRGRGQHTGASVAREGWEPFVHSN